MLNEFKNMILLKGRLPVRTTLVIRANTESRMMASIPLMSQLKKKGFVAEVLFSLFVLSTSNYTSFRKILKMQNTERKCRNVITSMTILLILAVILLIAYKPSTGDNTEGKISEVTTKLIEIQVWNIKCFSLQSVLSTLDQRPDKKVCRCHFDS